VPFARMRGVRVEDSIFDQPRLILATEDGIIHAKLPKLPSSIESPRQLHQLIEQRRDAARTTTARMAKTRGDLGAWIAMVAASHATNCAGAHYRASFVDAELLEQTLSDPTDAIEARAASAHALLARGRSDLVAPRIHRESPPFVIAATRLARGGETLVSDALLDEVLPFLELRDRVVFAQHARAHVRVA
jgi:hypothetical protein